MVYFYQWVQNMKIFQHQHIQRCIQRAIMKRLTLGLSMLSRELLQMN